MPSPDLPSEIKSDDLHSELADLRRQVEELRIAVQARDDFIAIAAHELRNPMTPILGLTELALKAARKADSPSSPRVTLLLERMQAAVQEFTKRATGLLDVSRIEAGNLRLEPSAVDLATIVVPIAQRYETQATRGGSPLELHVAEGVIATVDPLAFEQVVENLLSNALKFGIGQPVTLRLRTEEQSARLDVQDRGVGMQPEHQARIFERFEQVMTQHRSGGFGIGLWVASRLVAAMGGRIAVSSTLGAGSTFTVSLPLATLSSGSNPA
ncbi:sensor histidine kinase [Lichenifustis flavocetrariae]|uniref:histidine kinase n=1 Tax=Lichenifustis flavocetrariae TaxID=2949735 RepID=A0AA42CRA7_9HYPH|nr:HAMP domain-containing sensor histidine kinase [Lichenifustis flavocetrariae]MCW6512287.1 HAMP domain-containing histidine kinase [Lichenifustis flavocetrariae]